MKTNRSKTARSRRGLSLCLAAFAATALGIVAEKDAQACGGCFVPTENNTVTTDHRMVLTISPKETTLYDQIRYTGNPATFAWVLPISGTVRVGLSSAALFGALDAMTGTSVVQPPLNCPTLPNNCDFSNGKNATSPSAGAASDASAADNGVVVTKQETVGPFETVQLHSTDPMALNTWLSTNGFTVPADVQPIIAQYVTEHFDFLAMKLKPGEGVQSMRPVRVTSAGAAPLLPLRMVAAGTGAVVGITLWVVAEGRYEPQNFPFFQITNEDIVWDWPSSSSNFKALRKAREGARGGKGWEVESALDFPKQTIENAVQYGFFGGNGNGGPRGGTQAGDDYLPVKNEMGTVLQTPDEARKDDMKTLLDNIATPNARISRVRSDLNHAALSADLVLQASKDQSVMSNVRNPKLESGQPNCPVFDGCSVVGNAPRDEAVTQTQTNNARNAESFSCKTAARPLSGPLGLLAAGGFLGLAVLRVRRRRP